MRLSLGDIGLNTGTPYLECPKIPGPIIEMLPSVSISVAQTGQTLTATTGQYRALKGGEITITGEWYVDDALVHSGTSYVPTPEDQNKIIQFIETATESGQGFICLTVLHTIVVSAKAWNTLIGIDHITILSSSETTLLPPIGVISGTTITFQ